MTYSSSTNEELPIIQMTYDLVKWFVPLIMRFPRDYKFVLGDRMQTGLYNLLENLVRARYSRDKLPILERINAELDVLRYQTRLCREFDLMSTRRYEYASRHINEIGKSLGGWLRQTRQRNAIDKGV